MTPSLTGGGLPTEIKLYNYNYDARTGTISPGTGSASTGIYEGRDSLIIGTGSGNSFSRTYWNLTGPLAGGVTQGSFSISMHDAYGGTNSPYYMNFILYTDQDAYEPGKNPVLLVGWQDYGNPNFDVSGPGLPMQRFARSLGWNDFRVDWNSNSISLLRNGDVIYQQALSVPPIVRSIEIAMHDVEAAGRTFGASGISITAESYAETTKKPVLTVIATNGTAKLTWDAAVTAASSVEHSADMSGWTTISASNSTGTFQHAFGTATKGFYRLRWESTNSPSAQMITVQGGVLPPPSQIAGTTVSTFRIGKYEVTWDEWREVRAWAVTNGYTDLAFVGGGSAGGHPVHSVNWFDVAKWCNAKSEMEGLTPVYLHRRAIYRTGQTDDFNLGEWDANAFSPVVVAGANGYRLPSVAEWEWAARGGLSSKGYTYSGSNDVNAVAWYVGNSGGSTKAVGKKQANELGLHDMTGNVAEWCFDPMRYTITRIGGLYAELGRPRCGSHWGSTSTETVAFRRRMDQPFVAGRGGETGFRVARNAP